MVWMEIPWGCWRRNRASKRPCKILKCHMPPIAALHRILWMEVGQRKNGRGVGCCLISYEVCKPHNFYHNVNRKELCYRCSIYHYIHIHIFLCFKIFLHICIKNDVIWMMGSHVYSIAMWFYKNLCLTWSDAMEILFVAQGSCMVLVFCYNRVMFPVSDCKFRNALFYLWFTWYLRRKIISSHF